MFQNLDIITTLSVCPSAPKAHKIIFITRGASASLAFNFAEKVYNFEYTDQITFIFKQNKQIIGYKMFEYLRPTTDATPQPNKTYYTNVEPLSSESNQCTGVLVQNPNGNPCEQGFYEVLEDGGSWRDTLYIMDEHFYHAVGDGYDYITLMLSSEETCQFNTTSPEANMPWEVVVRLNTDLFESLNHQDSIVIEPQHSIAVIDSLYGQLKGGKR